MSATSLARKAVQLEVALLRPPLLLADRVAARVGAGPVRSTVRQGLAVLDAVADRIAEPSAPAAPAPARRATPQPPATEAQGDPTEDELVEQVAEELLEEQELAPLAGELAEDDELRRVQAELNAKRLVEEQEQRPRD